MIKKTLPAHSSLTYRILRYIYHALPIPHQQKIKLRGSLTQLLAFPQRNKKSAADLKNHTHLPAFTPLKKITNFPDIFIFSLIDWNFQTQCPQQYIATALAEQGYRVFYISNNFLNYSYPVFEAKKLSDKLALYYINLSLENGAVRYKEELSVNKIQQLILSLTKFMLWAETSRLIALVQHPFWVEIAFSLPNAQVIYDRIDYPAAFNETSSLILEKENQLLKDAHLVLTESQKLFNFQNTLEEIQEPLVSIIILTHNNLYLTKACLGSVEKYTDYKNIEIIIVDNASTDNTPDFLRENYQNREHYKIILNPENKGFAAGNNIGLKIARGEYLVLLNNDTRVTPGWFRTMLNHFRRNPNLGLLGPVTNNIGNEAKIHTEYKNPDDMFPEVSEIIYKNMGSLLPLKKIAFFCVMIPRAVFEKIGLLDESYGMGFFEDDDYCQRVQKEKYEIFCAEDVFIHHHLSASFDQMKTKTRQELFEKNKKIYEAKWGEWQPHRYR
jgi:GT2 family glycosyltransferase